MSHSDRSQRIHRREGAAARAAGRPAESCPYHSRVSARDAWLEGWQSTEAPQRVPHYDRADSPVTRHSRVDY